MKLRLYLDTSVLGAEFDTESPERVSMTQRLFELLQNHVHGACISAVTQEEVDRAPDRIRTRIQELLASFDLEILTESEDTERLANAYLADGAIPRGSENDARHLAISSVHGVDALVSWNYQHLVNVFRRRRVHAVNLRYGKPLIDIVSPVEALCTEEDDE